MSTKILKSQEEAQVTIGKLETALMVMALLVTVLLFLLVGLVNGWWPIS